MTDGKNDGPETADAFDDEAEGRPEQRKERSMGKAGEYEGKEDTANFGLARALKRRDTGRTMDRGGRR